jgi:hypothetical protein
MKRIVYALVLTALVLPAAAQAQHKRKPVKRPDYVVTVRKSERDCCWGNRFTFEPYGGAVHDAYDASPDGNETGYLVGLRLGYLLSSRTRVQANFGYSQTDNVSNPNGLSNYFVYDNNWIFTTGGAEFDVVPGRTSASVSLHAGAAWRRVDVDGQIGAPIGTPESDPGFSAQEVVIPSVLLRHRLTSRATLTAGLHDHIFDVFDGNARHGIGVTIGAAFR